MMPALELCGGLLLIMIGLKILVQGGAHSSSRGASRQLLLCRPAQELEGEALMLDLARISGLTLARPTKLSSTLRLVAQRRPSN